MTTYGHTPDARQVARSTRDRMALANVERLRTGAVIDLGEQAQNSPAEITDHLRATAEYVYCRGVALEAAEVVYREAVAAERRSRTGHVPGVDPWGLAQSA